jgi:2-phospho-L-lactate guanylyltransferase
VPVGSIEGAKSRLGAVLDAEERRDLALRLADTTIRAAVETPGVHETFVVTPDDEVRELAVRAGARPLRQRSGGLNDGLRQAREEALAAGADAILILPIDIPQVSPEQLTRWSTWRPARDRSSRSCPTATAGERTPCSCPRPT